MPSKFFPLLPKLYDNVAIAPTKAGQWADARGTRGTDHFLRGLADGIAVAESSKDIDSIDSIPDVWARPILFRMALFASSGFDSGLHEKVLGEWRALLAMLALQDTRHLSLTVDAVHLAVAKESGALGKTLFDLAPQDSANGQGKSAWSDIYVISYNNEPLAITSPTTLVTVTADYSTTLAGQLAEPWSIDGRHLTDPVSHLRLNELGGLHLWLKELKESLSKTIPADVQEHNETCTELFKAIDDYIQDVLRQAGGTFPAVGTIVPASLNMHIGIFNLLNKKVQAEHKDTDSAVLLRTSKTRSGSNPLLLVSPKMLQELSISRGLSLAQIDIWAGLTASNIKEHSLTGNRKMIEGVSLGNAEWRRPEEFFTDRLVVHAGGNALKGILKVPGSEILSKDSVIAPGGVSIILPLQPEILDYFTPQEIVRNFFIEKVGNNIRVQFTFPISGINGAGAEYRAEKFYPMQEIIGLVLNVPVIEIWPNFKRPGWQKYYLYYENSEAQNKTQEAGLDFFYVYPWAYGRDIAGDTPKKGLANLYTARLSGFPEAFICTVNLTADGEVYAGLILLDEPAQVPAQMGQTWQVGIDFGTSSTMLFFRNGNNTPQPLALQPNLFQVTESGGMRNRTYRNFIPSSTADQQAGSFLSIFQLLNGNLLKGNLPNIRPLQDGNVFWLLSADGPDADDFRDNSSQIDANLKWRNDQVSRLKVAAYVKQICLQSLAEAAKKGVGTISWNFSYPTAFSADQAMTFKTTCQKAVDEAIQDSGFSTGTIQAMKPEYWPESKAGAYYFSNLSGNFFAGGAVCLDIGAGTTDVSVISSIPARIVYHTSLQFAGRYLFQSIYNHYNIFAPSLNLGGMGKEQRNALIDADMRKHSEEYLYGLTNMTGQSDVQKVLKLAQFAVSGIFYYIGGLIKLLHEKGVYQGDDVPEIYVGGNGSRILPWICGGEFTEDNPYITVFQDMLVATSGLSLDYGFRMVLSDMPKVEVARGMIENKPHNHDDFFDARQQATDLFGEESGKDLLIANSVFAGDDFIIQGESRKKMEFISAYDVQKGISIRKANELRAFTKLFNENQYIWGDSIEINDQQFAKVARAVQGAYGQQVAIKDPKKIFVEPVFILEMKGFMEMVTHA